MLQKGLRPPADLNSLPLSSTAGCIGFHDEFRFNVVCSFRCVPVSNTEFNEVSHRAIATLQPQAAVAYLGPFAVVDLVVALIRAAHHAVFCFASSYCSRARSEILKYPRQTLQFICCCGVPFAVTYRRILRTRSEPHRGQLHFSWPYITPV